MIKIEELENIIYSLKKSLDKLDQSICKRLPVSVITTSIKSHPKIRIHSYFTKRVKSEINRIKNDFGQRAVALYFKLVLAVCMKDSILSKDFNKLPNNIKSELQSWYKRVLNDFKGQPDDYYDYLSFDFLPEIGVCSLNCLPVGGAWYVSIRRLGLKPLVTFNIFRIIKILGYVLLKMGGFKNYCVIHTFSRYLLRFNSKEMNSTHKKIGELMKLNPRIKGIYERSWFLNPNIENVSPELNYLREIPEHNGAIFFEVGTLSSTDIELSIKYSLHRKKLFEEGKYSPAAFAYIWPRNELLSYLENQTN